jgi:hypothetical protein
MLNNFRQNAFTTYLRMYVSCIRRNYFKMKVCKIMFKFTAYKKEVRVQGLF